MWNWEFHEVPKFAKSLLPGYILQKREDVDYPLPHELDVYLEDSVRQKLFTWINSKGDHPYIIQEAAILFESGFYEFFDKTIDARIEFPNH